MRLRRPPAAPAIVARPLWVRRYPVSYGFVVPSDRNGQLYAGLSLIRSSSVPACSTFAPGHTSRPVGCGAGLYCFVPRLPVSDGEFLACPADRGSRLFRRRQLRVPPFPW